MKRNELHRAQIETTSGETLQFSTWSWFEMRFITMCIIKSIGKENFKTITIQYPDAKIEENNIENVLGWLPY